MATNLARVLRRLKEKGVWLVGTTDGAEQDIYQADLSGPLGLVMGSEGKGMRRLTSELCDFLVGEYKREGGFKKLVHTHTACLLALMATGDEKYAEWHHMIHDWTYKYFPDPEYGEWYGYLHRDGRISVPLKGNLWKGPFHLPRMLHPPLSLGRSRPRSTTRCPVHSGARRGWSGRRPGFH